MVMKENELAKYEIVKYIDTHTLQHLLEQAMDAAKGGWLYRDWETTM